MTRAATGPDAGLANGDAAAFETLCKQLARAAVPLSGASGQAEITKLFRMSGCASSVRGWAEPAAKFSTWLFRIGTGS
jgi:hypothetical protein